MRCTARRARCAACSRARGSRTRSPAGRWRRSRRRNGTPSPTPSTSSATARTRATSWPSRTATRSRSPSATRRSVLADAGDLALPETPEAAALITAGVGRVIAAGQRPLALGGDHSVTFPVLRAIHAAFGPVTILHVDAHSDLYHEFEGDPFSHACPFARIMEAGLASRLVQVGIRTLNAHQRAQAARFGVEVIDMRAWAAGARPAPLHGPVYCSIDLDGLDPAHAPGVSHREPGGLTVREVLTVVQALPSPLVGADVVEYNPDVDLGGVTAHVGAKIASELAGQMLG
ncbi:MAG: arginase family protein [Gemmatimonadetes bacterium]|nr:arginase family protein [Gemmatimonadota bacterium]